MSERDMVERIARVIAAASLTRRAELEGVDPSGSEKARIVIGCGVDFLWPNYVETARDVLAAMREPTGEMIDAGCTQAAMPSDCWRAMIEAAEAEEAD